MIEFFQHMINMLILGSTYALLGIGLTLIFGIMRIVNFAHGELYAFGAYFVYFVAVLLGFQISFFISLLVAIVGRLHSGRPDRGWFCCAPDAWGGYRHHDADHDRRHDRDAEHRAICLGPASPKSVSTPFFRKTAAGHWSFVGFLAAAVSCSLPRPGADLPAAYFLINRDQAWQGDGAPTFQDRDTAALMGVNIQAIYMANLRHRLEPSRGGRRGRYWGPVYVVSPQMGNIASLKGVLRSVILGGPRQHRRGHHRRLYPWPSPKRWAPAMFPPAIRDAMGFLLIIAVLLFKPTGSVCAIGANWMKRFSALDRAARRWASVPMWLRDSLSSQCLCHHRNLHRRGDESETCFLGLYRAAQPWSRRVLWKSAPTPSALGRARFRCRTGRRLLGWSTKPWPVWLGFVIAILVSGLCGYNRRKNSHSAFRPAPTLSLSPSALPKLCGWWR